MQVLRDLGMNGSLESDPISNNGVMQISSDFVLGHPFVDPPFYNDCGVGQMVDGTSSADDDAYIAEFLDGILRNDQDDYLYDEVTGHVKFVAQSAPMECGFTKDSGSSSSDVEGPAELVHVCCASYSQFF